MGLHPSSVLENCYSCCYPLLHLLFSLDTSYTSFVCLQELLFLLPSRACFICYFRQICFFRQHLTNAFCWFCTTVHFWTYLAILHGKSNNMAAVQSKRVPLIRGYRDSLITENRKVYDQKLEFTAGMTAASRKSRIMFQRSGITSESR